MTLAATTQRPTLMAAKNVFNEDATKLARVNPVTEKALWERNEAPRLANMLGGYGNKAFKYEAAGTAPQLFGYPSTGAKGPTGIGYGGAVPNERFQILSKSGTCPLYIVPPTLTRVKVWLVKGTEGEGTRPEELRTPTENNSIQKSFEAVLMPLPSGIVAGPDTVKATIQANKKEIVAAQARMLCPGAAITGPGLEPGTLIGEVRGTTAVLSIEAKEVHAEAEYEITGTIWGEGTDKRKAIWCPATNEYWEEWASGVWAQPEYKAGTAYALHNVVVGAEKKLYECVKAMTSGESVGPPEATHWKEMPCKQGEYKTGYGSYSNEASEWNGICPNGWGGRADGLAQTGGHISLQDLTRVLRGGKIGHAIGVNVLCSLVGTLEPSTRSGETKTNVTKIPKFKAKIPASKKQLEGITSFLYLAEGAELAVGNGIAAGTFVGTISEGAKTAQLVNNKGEAKLAEAEHAEVEYEIVNPSAAEAGLKDAVKVGGWFAFGETFTATKAGLVRATEPLAYEIHEAVREHGLLVHDVSTANCTICINDPRVLGSPYAGDETNPFNSYKGASPSITAVNSYVNNHVPEGWDEPAGKEIKEALEGSTNPMMKLLATAEAVENFEQLAPRAS